MTRFLNKEERIAKLEEIRLALGIKKRSKVTGNFE
jgi:hypothetical protein